MRFSDIAKPKAVNTPLKTRIRRQVWHRANDQISHHVFNLLEDIRQSRILPHVRIMVQAEISSPVFYSVHRDIESKISDQIRLP